MADLELLGVSKVFPGGITAVDRLDLFVRDGELVVLVGPSGSGKTTTLRLIAGLEQPTSGSIRIGGRDVTRLAPRKRDLAMVFQQLGLYGHLTAQENTAFGLRLRQKGRWFGVRSGERLSASEIDQRVRQTAALLGIEDLLGRKPAELSGGEQQRVALGRAIVRRPRAMLLDEPLASLDVPTRLSLRRELKRLHRELAMTMVHVTHDQAEAMALGDRIAVIHGGRIEQVGTPEEIYLRPESRFVAGFFGSQGMNFLEGNCELAEQSLVFRRGSIEVRCPAKAGAALPGRDVIVGVRPEDVSLVEPGSSSASGQVSLGSGTVIEGEHLGENSFVRVKLDGAGEKSESDVKDAEWIFRAEPFAEVKVGQRKQVEVSQHRLHWFDPGSGKRIG